MCTRTLLKTAHSQGCNGSACKAGASSPDGHPKLLHLWPVKLLQAGRSDYDYVGVMAMREAASFRR